MAELQNIFDIVHGLYARLEDIYGGLRSNQRRHQQPARVTALAEDIQSLLRVHADVCLGAVHLTADPHYHSHHTIYTAFLVDQLAAAVRVDAHERLAMVAGALTHDLGMHRLMESLFKQEHELTPLQRQKVEQHTLAGERLLAEAGVKDEVWLDTVVHHHERLDGSGYPHRLSGEQVSRAVRILAACDAYSAMVTPHAYREGRSPVQALRELLTGSKGQFDEGFTQQLVKVLGIYPPGTLVKLKSGEVGVVRERGSAATTPRVAVLITAQGRLPAERLVRDCAEPEQGVENALNPAKLPKLAKLAYESWKDILFMPPEEQGALKAGGGEPAEAAMA